MSITNQNATASSVSSNASPASAVGTQLNRTTNAKVAGGGLEAGSTDFGSSTAPMSGGQTGVGSGAGQSYNSGNTAGGGGENGSPDGPANTAAGGLSVSATGRAMDPDGGTSGIAATRAGSTGVSQVSSPSLRTGSSLDRGTGSSAHSTVGTSTATPNDYVAAAPNLISPPRQDAADAANAPATMREQMRKATADASKATPPGTGPS